jgi:hypothetical protein
MKLRIKGNSIRLRLLRSEVERLCAADIVSEEVRFGTATDQALKYSIAASDGVEEVTVQFSDNQILVLLPESIAMDWTAGDGVGIETSIDVGNNTELSVLIEKDFECVGRPDDPDRADTFPNPSASCSGENNAAKG